LPVSSCQKGPFERRAGWGTNPASSRHKKQESGTSLVPTCMENGTCGLKMDHFFWQTNRCLPWKIRPVWAVGDSRTLIAHPTLCRASVCCGDAVRLGRCPLGRFRPLHGARVHSVIVPFSTLYPSVCVSFDAGLGRSLTLVQCSAMPYATTWDDFAESARAIFLAHPSRVRCVSLHWE